MHSTQNLLSLIDSLSEIRLFQIPNACKQIAQATCDTIINLPDEHPVESVMLAEFRVIDRVVRAYYDDVMESARQHMGSMSSSNLYAMDSANEYYYYAGLLLRALVEGFEELPAAKDLLLEAAKSYNDHIVEYSMSYKSGFRMKKTQELTALIQRLDPSYRKPVKCIPFFFWFAIVGLVLMLLLGHTLGPFDPVMNSTRSVDPDLYEPYQAGVSCVLFGYVEAVALAACVYALKSGKYGMARAAAIVPLGSRLLCAVTGSGFLYRLSYSGPAFSDLFDTSLIFPLQHISTGLNLLVLALLAAYLFGKIPTTRKNLIAGVVYCLAATVSLILFFFLSADWPRHGMTAALFALASDTAAAGLVLSFPPAVEGY